MCYNECHCSSGKPQELCSYAQYGVQSNPSSNTDLSMMTLFQEGKQLSLIHI